MQSRNKPRQTSDEATHVGKVAAMRCVVCDAPGPSEVHEIVQGLWWLSLPLCFGCHRSDHNGIHGQRRIWSVKKLDELRALAIVIQRLATGDLR